MILVLFFNLVFCFGWLQLCFIRHSADCLLKLVFHHSISHFIHHLFPVGHHPALYILSCYCLLPIKLPLRVLFSHHHHSLFSQKSVFGRLFGEKIKNYQSLPKSVSTSSPSSPYTLSKQHDIPISLWAVWWHTLLWLPYF